MSAGAANAQRALVLDGHSRAAVETLQALGRAGAVVDVSAETDDVLAFRSRYARQRFRQPAAALPETFLDWLQDLDGQNGYTLVVPATEAALIALNALPDGHRLRAKAVLPPRKAIATALDKESTWQLAARLGIPVPRSALVAAETGGAAEAAPTSAPAFPTVLKPVHSKVAIDGRLLTVPVAIVADADARRRYLDAWLPHVAIQEQAYFAGHGVGIELLFADGVPRWHFAHERVHEAPLTGGASTYRRSIAPPPALLADACRLLAALNWHGVAMVEFKRNGDGDYRLMEINPRLWGSLALSIDAGVDFPRGLLALAAGQPLAAQPDYTVGYYTRSLFDDLRWLHENGAADPADPLLLTRPVVRSYLELLRPLTGRESWDHFDARDPAVTAAIIGRIFRLARDKLARQLAPAAK
jgi:predicted ATP-grasp superfamily ATP-dependent carboligase